MKEPDPIERYVMANELLDLIGQWITRGYSPLNGGRLFGAVLGTGFGTGPSWRKRLAYFVAAVRGFLGGV